MRIAVVGSGIAGLATAWLLSRKHEVTLFEANDYFGGHTHTHEVEQAGRSYAVDSGFIVYNRTHYPLLSRLFDELGVRSQATTMSFSVRNEASGLEYNASTLNTLFCQRRNLVSPRFLGMVRDLLRFYREAPVLLEEGADDVTLGEYLARHRYGAAFRDEHLVPMASALWSSPPIAILDFPARYLVRFLANHQMLESGARAQWSVVCGGSSSYVRALRANWRVRERGHCAVRAVRRGPHGILLRTSDSIEVFDAIVFACHSDEALALLDDADANERAILGAIAWQDNDVVLHTDRSLLPVRRSAWASWNAFLPRQAGAACTVSYCMNLLQGIESPEPFVVTLNRTEAIDRRRILKRMRYRHPLYTLASVQARQRKREIQGRRNTWYAGAYWGWGFHEDGLRSAVEVAAALGVYWPRDRAAALAPAPRHRETEFAS